MYFLKSTLDYYFPPILFDLILFSLHRPKYKILHRPAQKRLKGFVLRDQIQSVLLIDFFSLHALANMCYLEATVFFGTVFFFWQKKLSN